MLLQEGEELLLERAFAMMLLLVTNIRDGGLQLGNADGEGAITILPRKRFAFRKFSRPLRDLVCLAPIPGDKSPG